MPPAPIYGVAHRAAPEKVMQSAEHYVMSGKAEEPLPILDWSKIVKPQLQPAKEFGPEAKVVSEMSARAIVIRVLAEYGITPRTTE